MDERVVTTCKGKREIANSSSVASLYCFCLNIKFSHRSHCIGWCKNWYTGHTGEVLYTPMVAMQMSNDNTDHIFRRGKVWR